MFNDNATKWIYKTSFPSVFGGGAEFVEEVVNAMKLEGWNDDDVFAVNLSLVEAITNAIEHGNQENPEKTVHVTCVLFPSLIRLIVRDEGEGFLWGNVPDPRKNDRICCPSGRGLFLINGFMSKVVHNSHGNEITMERARSEEPCLA